MSRLLVLTNDSGRPSANSLGFPVYDNYEAEDLFEPDVCVLRWGSSELAGDGRGQEYDNVLNPRRAIKKNTDKLRALSALKMAVNVPQTFRERITAGVKAIIRPISHSRGEGLFYVTGPARVPADHYGIESIENTREFRVWFTPDDILGAERVPIATSVDRSSMCPNRADWGYSFTELSDEFVAEVRRAAAIIGLHVGAADVLKTRDGKRVFLELNSCPSLDHVRVRTFFINSLNRMVRSTTTEEEE